MKTTEPWGGLPERKVREAMKRVQNQSVEWWAMVQCLAYRRALRKVRKQVYGIASTDEIAATIDRALGVKR